MVAEYLATGSVARATRVQTAVTQTFRDDFGKYARASRHHLLDRVFLHAARLAGRKFMYSKVDPDSRSRDLRAAVELLERAGVVHRVCSTSGAGLPLGAEADDRHYKLVMVDVGLMQNVSGATEQLLDGDPMRINDGAVAEQFVGQELLAHRSRYERPELFYWRRRQKNSSAEVDYLVAAAGRGARLRRSPSSGRRLGIGPALRSGAPAALPGRDDRSGSGGTTRPASPETGGPW